MAVEPTSSMSEHTFQDHVIDGLKDSGYIYVTQSQMNQNFNRETAIDELMDISPKTKYILGRIAPTRIRIDDNDPDNQGGLPYLDLIRDDDDNQISIS